MEIISRENSLLNHLKAFSGITIFVLVAIGFDVYYLRQGQLDLTIIITVLSLVLFVFPAIILELNYSSRNMIRQVILDFDSNTIFIRKKTLEEARFKFSDIKEIEVNLVNIQSLPTSGYYY